ncbi:MAG: potassium channel family protein [Gammaproteobacteria bacterium]|nr:potassium channel family protein [Gammaproteobacteria bacterium]NNK98029.1 two pore domain potassium channel family protein [Xanthomonadales bacterium]
MLEYVIGIAMVAVTVTIHVTGSTYWLEFAASRFRGSENGARPRDLFSALIWTTVALIFLHIIETMIWATVYVSLPGKAGLAGFSEAVYFSIVTITTLGYGDVTLHENWRILGGMQAMVGITIFGLTTAILFAVVQRFWKVKYQLT